MHGIDHAPLSPGSTPNQQTLFAHSIADRLSQDIAERCGLLQRRFGRKVELYVLDEHHHVSDDLLQRTECRYSHVKLSHDNPDERKTTRDIVARCLPAILERHKLPFHADTVEVDKIEVYELRETGDSYSTDYALHIVLTR